jgi:ornithine cyclodeaminase
LILLNEEQIKRFYKMEDALKDVEQMLMAKQKDKVLAPIRTVIDFPEKNASSLYMPSADLEDQIAAVKVVTIFPDNPGKGLPTTQGILLLSSTENGEHLAVMNASYLTSLRTGAMTGLATMKLASIDAKSLTVIGTGRMAFEQVLGVLSVRKIESIYLYNRTKEKAHRFKQQLIDHGVTAFLEVVDDVNEAVSSSDIVCCATNAKSPVFDGNYLKPGAHVNGVGSYLPHMLEVDRTTIRKASKIVVDDVEGVKEEAGELIDAHKSGEWSFSNLHGELAQLVSGKIAPREHEEEITFFKSVGASYYDLAVAKGVYKKAVELHLGISFEM